MVQECYKYVDAVTDLNIKLRLIDTLRTVTAGKVCQKKAIYLYISNQHFWWITTYTLMGNAVIPHLLSC